MLVYVYKTLFDICTVFKEISVQMYIFCTFVQYFFTLVHFLKFIVNFFWDSIHMYLSKFFNMYVHIFVHMYNCGTTNVLLLSKPFIQLQMYIFTSKLYICMKNFIHMYSLAVHMYSFISVEKDNFQMVGTNQTV